MRNLVLFLLWVFSLTAAASAAEVANVIKVKGAYAIISKGSDQGVKRGQIYLIKRPSHNTLVTVAKVQVLRVTANRAAVEVLKIEVEGGPRRGDRLFSSESVNQRAARAVAGQVNPVNAATVSVEASLPAQEKKAEPAAGSGPISVLAPESTSNRRYQPLSPWLGINLGGALPNGDLGQIHSAGFRFGASYLIGISPTFNLGIEINQVLLGKSGPGSANFIGSGNLASASVLEAILVLQRSFGRFFFLETGGGIFRPKFRTVSTDYIEASFSASKFGVFGGAGVFMPTSSYAGFVLSGRVHNYFDQTNKQYFGVTGGFRFRIH